MQQFQRHTNVGGRQPRCKSEIAVAILLGYSENCVKDKAIIIIFS